MRLDDSGFLDIGSQRLEYRMIGPRPETAPTIGAAARGPWLRRPMGRFRRQLTAATGLGVFVYSRAGYGQSSPVSLPRPLTYMHDEARETLPRLLETIGFQRGLLVGHSDGASIAAIYAGSRQDHRVGGLVLIAPHFFTEDVRHQRRSKKRARPTPTGDLRASSRAGTRMSTTPSRAGTAPGSIPNSASGTSPSFLAYIRVPVLIVQGEDDQYGTVKQIEAAERECYCPVEVALLHRRAPFAATRGAGGDAESDFGFRCANCGRGWQRRIDRRSRGA